MANGRPARSCVPAAVVPALCILATSLARADVDLAVAKQQFETSCGTCHTVDPNGRPRQGPNLAGIYGRKAGTLPGFAYSAALKDAGFTWDEASLDKWISDAQAFRPGAVMPYHQANPQKRKLVIDYLKSITPAAQ